MNVEQLYYATLGVDARGRPPGVRVVTRIAPPPRPDFDTARRAQALLQRAQAERAERLRVGAVDQAQADRVLAADNAKRAASMLAARQAASAPVVEPQAVIYGLACPFDESVPHDGGLWRFRPSAFASAIATNDIRLIVNHEAASPTIASTFDRNLHLWEGNQGLLFRYTPEGAIGETVLAYAKQHAYVGVSAGFKRAMSTAIDVAGTTIFTAAHLVEISLVPRHATPAFASTWVRVLDGHAVGARMKELERSL